MNGVPTRPRPLHPEQGPGSRAVRRVLASVRLLVLWACVMAIHIAIRCFGFRRVQRRLARRLPARGAGTGGADDTADAFRLGTQWLKRRLPEPWAGNCLSRSVALWWLLARRGVPSTLHIGARRHDGDFRAHAWVEYAGRPLNAKRRIREKYQAFDHTFDDVPDA